MKDGIAKVQPVKVARVMDSQSILEGGLEGGELVVTEGQVQIIDGSAGLRVRDKGRVLR